MRMQVSEYEGIAWKFMDRLILYIRVESDITRGIRKPVTADFLTF